MNLKAFLNIIRRSQAIEDPFLEDTRKEREWLLKPFCFFRKRPIPSVSIWDAYMKGYNKAYDEIEMNLEKHLELKEREKR